MVQREKILVLTPMKDASRFLADYFQCLSTLTYPSQLISLAFLESDSRDGTIDQLALKLDEVKHLYRKVKFWKKDFGFLIPPGVVRHAGHIQVERRITLAKSRNQLLFRALEDEDWVLWLDVDVTYYPPDIIERLLSFNKDIVHPNCVLHFGGPSFDLNAWSAKGKNHMHDLRGEEELVPLDSVGGTMLLIKADVHRNGLIFPAFPYGKKNAKIREDNLWLGEIETEGLGIMADDMGIQCWGAPNVEIIHRSE